jgi:hypothetical protein
MTLQWPVTRNALYSRAISGIFVGVGIAYIRSAAISHKQHPVTHQRRFRSTSRSRSFINAFPIMQHPASMSRSARPIT